MNFQDEGKMSSIPAGDTAEPPMPVSFRLDTYWKLPRGAHGVTHAASRRLALSEVLDFLLTQLSDEEATVESDGTVTTVTINWDKVPQEVRNPFAFGVRR